MEGIIPPISYSASRESPLYTASGILKGASSVDLNLKKLSRSKCRRLLATYIFKHTCGFGFSLLPQGTNSLSLVLHEKTSSVALSGSIRMSRESACCPWSSGPVCQYGHVQILQRRTFCTQPATSAFAFIYEKSAGETELEKGSKNC